MPKRNVGHTLSVAYKNCREDPDFRLNERREVKSYVAVEPHRVDSKEIRVTPSDNKLTSIFP